MTADHEPRLRQVEGWQIRHEAECTARHKALNLRFDQADAVTEEARLEAEAARKAAEAAVVSATAAASAAAIGRATILGWLKALVFAFAATAATLLSGSPIVQAAWKLVRGVN